MQTNQNGGHPFLILSQAIAYLLGGIFLCTATVAGVPSLVAQIFGGIFIVFAFLLVVASFSSKLIAWTTKINLWLFLALFFVSMASLIKIALELTECRISYIVLAVVFLLLVLAALLFQLFRMGTNLRIQLGTMGAAARMLRGLCVALSLFALAMVIMQVDSIGGPILYLALGLVCLSIASLL